MIGVKAMMARVVPAIPWSRLGESVLLALCVGGGLSMVVAGIAAVSLPAAAIVGGLILVALGFGYLRGGR